MSDHGHAHVVLYLPAPVCVFFTSFASRGRSARSIEAAAGRDGRAGLVDAGARVERGAREDRSNDAIDARESARDDDARGERERGEGRERGGDGGVSSRGGLIHGETERPDEDDGAEEKAREDGEAEKFAEALCAKSRGRVFETGGARGDGSSRMGAIRRRRRGGGDGESLAGEDAKAVKRVMECVTASVSERVGLGAVCDRCVQRARGADVGTKLRSV